MGNAQSTLIYSYTVPHALMNLYVCTTTLQMNDKTHIPILHKEKDHWCVYIQPVDIWDPPALSLPLGHTYNHFIETLRSQKYNNHSIDRWG